jgi:AraC-like DNA-binding protein
VTLTNYHEVARFVGLDPEQMISRSGLPSAALDDPDHWLPAFKILNLIDNSAARSGRDDFGVLLGACRSFASLGPVSLLMRHESTVRDIFFAVAEYKHLVNDLLHVRVCSDEESAAVEWSLVPGLHSSEGINLVAAIAYRCVSEALGTAWEPDCVHFRHATPHNLATFRQHFDCSLEFNSTFDGMSCAPEKLLTLNPSADPALAVHARKLLNLLPGVRRDSASDKVRSVLVLLINDGEVTCERVAQCLGVEVRTLQRRLITEGTSFTELLTEARRDLVTRHLLHSTQPLAMVAHIAGYSSLSAFTRWFTREFGVPPRKWRAQQVNSAEQAF